MKFPLQDGVFQEKDKLLVILRYHLSLSWQR